jgi:hypothetical protein
MSDNFDRLTDVVCGGDAGAPTTLAGAAARFAELNFAD